MSPKPNPSCLVDVRVTPRSSRNRMELESGIVRIWTSAPPTDGQANVAVCEMLAKAAGVPKSSVSVVKGASSRNKQVRIDGIEDFKI